MGSCVSGTKRCVCGTCGCVAKVAAERAKALAFERMLCYCVGLFLIAYGEVLLFYLSPYYVAVRDWTWHHGGAVASSTFEMGQRLRGALSST